MGIILGGLVENTLKQSMLLFDMQWWMFFTRPICLTFFVLTFLGLAGPFLMKWLRGRQQEKSA